jgi:hypothetical protein
MSGEARKATTPALGPTVRIELSCSECLHCKTKGYACQGDSGSDVYCNYDGTLRHIGDTRWDTPEWCPFRRDAIREAVAKAAGR